MNEKRKHKRLPISLKLHVSSLFRQDNVQIQNLDAPIEVINISKSGIGFISKGRFPLHYYFNATLNLGDPGASLYSVLEIVRSAPYESDPDVTMYGCRFVGLASVFDFIFDDYEHSLD